MASRHGVTRPGFSSVQSPRGFSADNPGANPETLKLETCPLRPDESSLRLSG